MEKEPFFTIKEKRFYLRLFVIVLSILLISYFVTDWLQPTTTPLKVGND